QLLALVVTNAVLRYTPLAWLRDVAEAPSAENLLALRDRLEFVRGIGLKAEALKDITPWRFRTFAREGAKVAASDLSRYGDGKLLAILAAQVVSLATALSDAGVEMFCKLIGNRFSRS